jgi:tRNA U34 2-thiouridine synthase MnmA/TrmU
VIKINPSNKEVVVGSRKDLNITEFEVNEMNWILDAKDEFEAFGQDTIIRQEVKSDRQEEGRKDSNHQTARRKFVSCDVWTGMLYV